jgi:hypothetical protein
MVVIKLGIIIIIIIFLHEFCRLTCSGIEALPSFPGASKISCPSRFVVEGVTEMQILACLIHAFCLLPTTDGMVVFPSKVKAFFFMTFIQVFYTI